MLGRLNKLMGMINHRKEQYSTDSHRSNLCPFLVSPESSGLHSTGCWFGVLLLSNRSQAFHGLATIQAKEVLAKVAHVTCPLLLVWFGIFFYFADVHRILKTSI